MSHRAVHGTGDHPGQDGRRVSDEQLLRAVREGDSHAFATLYERHRGAALAVARMHSRNEPEAEDLVSEAFTRVFALLKEGKGPREFLRAYLVTAVSRLAADRANELNRTRPEDPQPDGPLDRVQLFDDTVVRQVDSVVVARAFASLPERWQEVLWYLEIEGRRPRQVASAVGIQPNAVSALGKRAREGLRTAYMQEHVSARALEDCGEYSRQLGAFARGSLTPSRTKVVQEHLDSCPRCTAEYLQLQDLGIGMRGWLLPVLAGLPLWGGAGDRLVEALAGTSLAGFGAASQAPGAAGTSAVEGTAGSATAASGGPGTGGSGAGAGASSGATAAGQSSGIAAFASSGTGLAIAAVGVLVAAAAAVGIVAVSNSPDNPSGDVPVVAASPDANSSDGDAAASGARGSFGDAAAGRDDAADGGGSDGGASGNRGSAAGAGGARDDSGGSDGGGSVALGDSDASRPDQARENAPQGRGPDEQVGRDQGDSRGLGPGGAPLPGDPGAPGNGAGGATSSTAPDPGTDPDVTPTTSPSPSPGDADPGGNPADPGEGTSPAPSDATQSPVPSPSNGVTSPPPTTTDPDCEKFLEVGGVKIICLDGLPPVPTLPPLSPPPLPPTPLLPSALVPSVSLTIVMPR